MNWIKGGGKEKKEKLCILILTGILLLVVFLPVGKKEKQQNTTAAQEQMQESTVQEIAEEDYVKLLEERLSKALSYMDGAGSVKVMITLKSSEEQVVEKDAPSRRNNSTETDGDTAKSSNEFETEESTVYLTDSEGNQIPYVVKKMEPVVEGVVVIASGGGNAEVKKNITEMIQALFGIEPHKIKVVKMKKIQ